MEEETPTIPAGDMIGKRGCIMYIWVVISLGGCKKDVICLISCKIGVVYLRRYILFFLKVLQFSSCKVGG